MSEDQQLNDQLFNAIKSYTISFGNFWALYFLNIRNKTKRRLGEGWIDFEAEIGNIVQILEDCLLDVSRNRNSKMRLSSYPGVGDILSDADILMFREIILPRIRFDFLVFTLWIERALKDIDKASREYGKTYKKVDLITHYIKDTTDVISYNYTHTIDILYRSRLLYKTHYLHGEIGCHNLVLGTGETLSGDLDDSLIDCAYFKKRYQIIRQRLNVDLKEKIFSPRHNLLSNIWRVIIYGHSLSLADRYSLGWIFLSYDENSQRFAGYIKDIIIYYYDDLAYDQLIVNLIRLIGQDKALQYVSEGKIQFIRMEDNSENE